MQKTEYSILSLFKKQPNKAFSTFDIAKAVYGPQIARIEAVFQEKPLDKEKVRKAKREKARIHRKLLYHLNKLISKSIIKVIKEGSKGEKFFEIDLKQGEELVVDKYSKQPITVSKPHLPAMPIEGYEQMGIVSKFEEPSWIDRLNSVVFEASMLTSSKLYKNVKESFDLVNDAIAVNEFHLLLEKDNSELLSTLSRLESDARSYGRKVSLIMDLDSLSNIHLEFFEKFCEKEFEFVRIVFNTDAAITQNKAKILEKIIEYMHNHRGSLMIKNSSLVKSPHFIGNAGVYNFNEDEYSAYLTSLKGSLGCVSCTQSCLNIDIKKFYDNFGFNIDNFNRFMLNCAESLLSANALQRRRSIDYFKYLSFLNSGFERQTFMFSRNYLRFLNYDFLNKEFDEKFVVDLFEKLKILISEFCMSEETIYKSCGMPTRFRIALGDAFFHSYVPKDSHDYINIRQLSDFHSENVKSALSEQELLFSSFDGGSIVEFIRTGNFSESDVLREVTMVLNSYRIPFFVYDFSKSRGHDLRLGDFING